MSKRLMRSMVARLAGLECWNVNAGSGAGSGVALDFGKKLLRPKLVENQDISERSRQYVGEYALFIQNCAWRLETERKVLCCWRSSNLDGEEMLVGLAHLVDKKIEAAFIENAALDLTIRFQSRFTLRLFSDCLNTDEEGENYSVFGPRTVLSVGGYGHIRSEFRSVA